jgi:hypothetical protein
LRKEGSAVALKVVAELDGGTVIRPDQLYEQLSPLHERPAAQILAIEVQEIEGKENDPVRRCVDGGSQCLEIGNPLLVLDNHLAIDQGGFADQPGTGRNHPLIGR